MRASYEDETSFFESTMPIYLFHRLAYSPVYATTANITFTGIAWFVQCVWEMI